VAIQVNGEGWRLEGPLTISTAADTLAEAERAWPPQGWTIDLSGLEQVDSAALSVLLSWQRKARSESAAIKVTNVPPSLCSLADVYGVRDLIGADPLPTPAGR
jgi:phospholipid transport system transporter-binding protein